MNSRINHKNIVTKKNRLSNLFYVRQAVASATFFSDIEKLKFMECAKHPRVNESGYVLYYTNQCPFNAKYVPIVEKTAKENNIPFKVIHITRKEQARNVPSPITTYALFYDGEYLTNEIMNEKKFLKLINA